MLLNKRNFLILLGMGLSCFVWTNSILTTVDQKVFGEMIIGFLLIPFLFDVYGRPLHVFLTDTIRYFFSRKQQKIVIGKDVAEGIVVVSDYQYSRVYRIEPVNLSMSSEEDVFIFKKYLQQALFALKNPIQIITIQKLSTKDKNLATEINRQKNLAGILRKRCKEYLLEYQELTQTMERNFFIVMTTFAKDLSDAQIKLEEQENSFGNLLEQSKIKLSALTTKEILELCNYISNRDVK